jgi:hypothetical protein
LICEIKSNTSLAYLETFPRATDFEQPLGAPCPKFAKLGWPETQQAASLRAGERLERFSKIGSA